MSYLNESTVLGWQTMFGRLWSLVIHKNMINILITRSKPEKFEFQREKASLHASH
jgi:hypothetical protein